VDGATSAGGGAKTVKIIKVKVEKGTDLQELAKQLTRKIKDERDRQALTRQQQTLQSSTGVSGASNSLQVVIIII
jgi:RNA binding exosome subunit